MTHTHDFKQTIIVIAKYVSDYAMMTTRKVFWIANNIVKTLIVQTKWWIGLGIHVSHDELQKHMMHMKISSLKINKNLKTRLQIVNILVQLGLSW